MANSFQTHSKLVRNSLQPRSCVYRLNPMTTFKHSSRSFLKQMATVPRECIVPFRCVVKAGGLGEKGQRNHIHFAPYDYSDKRVISGMAGCKFTVISHDVVSLPVCFLIYFQILSILSSPQSTCGHAAFVHTNLTRRIHPHIPEAPDTPQFQQDPFQILRC